LIRCLCVKCAETETLDAGEDVVGGLGPAEWLGVGGGRVDVRLDRLFEVADRAEHAPFQGALGEQGEEAFDLVDPRRRCRGEVHVPAGPFREPVADELGPVRSVVVHDDVKVEVGGQLSSTSSRNLRNSLARGGGMHWPMTVPAFTSSAANSDVVPFRL
jgi:hypothetical protein